MEYRLLMKEECSLLREIDRRETVDEVYYFRNGELELVAEHYDISGWDKPELENYILRLQDISDRNGTIYGAFDNGKITGLAALESKFIGQNKDKIKFDMLYIDSSYRKKGIGKSLILLIKSKAEELGAKSLYISATPFRNTVDFYFAMGAELTSEIDKELFKLEPLDIHMELK